jgi:hypothetical protein
VIVLPTCCVLFIHAVSLANDKQFTSSPLEMDKDFQLKVYSKFYVSTANSSSSEKKIAGGSVTHCDFFSF